MKAIFLFFSALILAWAQIHSTQALAGGSEVGNGTDNLPADHGSAWFIGAEKKIHACYKLTPDFGASADEVENAVKFAFDTWDDYLQERQVLSTMKQELGASFALGVNLSSTCTGQEDVRFEFGGSSLAILTEKSKLENPTAFSVRENYDLNRGWGRGFVWIAPNGSVSVSKSPSGDLSGFPNWSKGNALKLTLLHEVGHIYGCPHVRGTVMDEYLSSQIQKHEDLLTQVDQRNQLVFCWKCKNTHYSGQLGYVDSKSEDSESRVFTSFMGRKATGKVDATLMSSSEKIALAIQDSTGRKEIPLQFNEGVIHTGFDRGERFFKAVVAAGPGEPPKVFDFFNGGRVQYGSIKNAKGEILNLVMEVNTHSLNSPGPYTLRWLANGKAHSLFFANTK